MASYYGHITEIADVPLVETTSVYHFFTLWEVTKGCVTDGTSVYWLFCDIRQAPGMFRKKKDLGKHKAGFSETPPTRAHPAAGGEAHSSGKTSVTALSSCHQLDQELSCLYRATANQLFRYAVLLTRDPSLAQDAVQETFLRYYVQRRRSEIPEERAWLFRVLRNYVIDQQKSVGAKKAVNLDAAYGYVDKTQSPHRVFECSEAMQLVVGVLSPREYQCLQLRAEGFSYREIGGILAIESGTVGALLARGSEKIRRAFAEEGLPCEAI